MEENNYRDEFELFLKESADDFKMVPSRRIWYSIYNNLHPDRKWPSMAVCLFILTAVLYIGIANNNSLSSAARKASKENFTYSLNEKNTENKFTFSPKNYLKQKDKQRATFSLDPLSEGELESLETKNDNIVLDTAPLVANNEVSFINNINNLMEVKNVASVNNSSNQKAFDKNNKNDRNIKLESDFELQETTKQNLSAREIDNTLIAATDTLPLKLINTQIFQEKNKFSNVEKSWLEDYSFRNKPAINKFKQNTTLSYYITPSLGYRILSKIKENNGSYSSFAAGRTNNEPIQLLNNAALNLEVGFALQYKVSKRFRIKSGIQANYTNYVSNVTALGHPLETSITINNNNNNNIRSSNYSSKAGNDKINKTTIQIALPLGADFKIAGNQKVGWYAGGNIQPTYILGGSAYVLSADEKYYISEKAMLRKFNFNTSIETFISFKSYKGVVLNVGPQFRYQLLSTYKKSYGYTENLYNVGVKVGVNTPF